MRITDRLEIHAPIDRVWDLTMDVESWPRHTSTITSVERLDSGPLAIGSTARIKQPGQRTRIWTVTALEPGQRFEWATNAMGVRMTGGHHLAPTANGTLNTLTVEIEGTLSPLVGWLLRGPMRRAIATENRGFKRAAEGLDSSSSTIEARQAVTAR